MADINQLKKWILSDWQAQAEFREQSQNEYVFESGGQWTDDERVYLENEQRVPIVFNRVQPIIHSVSGLEITNRTEVQFIPREIGDVKSNEILTSGAKWFRDAADAEESESDAFRDLLICGIGWTETSLDFEEDEEGEPNIERIDPLEMGYDSRARKRGLTDSSRFFRVHKMSKEEAVSQWPEVDPSILDADWLSDTDKATVAKTINRAEDEYAYLDDGEIDYADIMADTVTVVQIQYREREAFVEYVDPVTGQTEQITQASFDKITKDSDIQITHRKFHKRTWRQAFIGSDIIAENVPCRERSTFCPMTGMWDVQDKRFYGLLRIMMDPQRYANKWLSMVLHIINSNAKGGLISEEGAVSDVRKFEESWASADSISWVKSGALNRIMPKSGPAMPASIMQLTEFAINSIRDVSGVNLEIMGMRNADQAGVLEYQRRQSAMTTLAQYFDAMRKYRKSQGMVILYYLREYIAPSGRLVRILEEGQERYVPLAMNDSTVKYDVIVDDAPASPDQKEKTWSVLQEMMPLIMQAELNGEDWAEILSYSPLPSSLIEKVRERAQGDSNQEPDPAEQIQLQMLQAELEKTKAEIAKLQSEAAENVVDIQEKQAETNLNQAKAQFINSNT